MSWMDGISPGDEVLGENGPSRNNPHAVTESERSDVTAEDCKEYATKFRKLRRRLLLNLPFFSKRQKIPPTKHVDGEKEIYKVKNDNPSKFTMSTALLADCQYDMSYPRRGKAVLINIANFEADTDKPERLNTAIDVDGLRQVLQNLGFLVTVCEDFTCEEIRRLMYSLSEEDHSDADCLLVAVMTHGDDGEIYASDGPMPTQEITAPFRGDACPSLVGKPKLFIFQACRGMMVDQGVAMGRHHDVDETDAHISYEKARSVPVEADFLMAYSSPEGYASWRNATTGAWFIQSLVQALEANDSSWEFTRILTLVSRMVALQYESLSENTFMARKKQMPCFVSTLTKELYFRPKGNPLNKKRR